MKDPAGSHAHLREVSAVVSGGGAAPALKTRLPIVADPSAKGAEGFAPRPAGRFHEVQAPVSKEAACSACRDEKDAPEMNYRIVLRCTTAG